MKRMKKLVALLLAVAMVTSMAACGKKEEPAQDNAPAAEDTADAPQETGGDAETPADDTVYDIKVSGHPYIHALASVYAIDQGYFKCEDTTVDMYSGGPVQNEAIASGAWDVGTTGTGGIVLRAVG